ncbi:hypothetical protein QBC35DRAFT_481221 [Podospora australis]|uniref:Autophagy protein n=1 Tax=Podospora australis TaxID=1536484 RepID=A0AAN6X5A5_9PEZI|nr:hypothetical protein QBC35DRAFT_481221 [Podospora australis]
MGWLGGWFGGSSNAPSDPLGNLDPKLREFLQKESPVKFNTPDLSEHQPPPPPPQQSIPQQSSQNDTTPAVPRESLFQDGRYAHLWKNYRSQASIDAEFKSDHERLMDVLDAFKERKAAIGRAALENCAEEQFTWATCMKSGGISARMTMCRAEVQKFERCYQTQSRLLKALGYLNSYGRSAEVDEEIQMRADELYQRIVHQQAEIAKAKEEGREPPAFDNVFKDLQPMVAPDTYVPSMPKPTKQPLPSPEQIAAWKEKLEKVPELDRKAEEEALKAEWLARVQMAQGIQHVREEQARQRAERKAKGEDTWMDKFKTMMLGNGPNEEGKSS